MFEGSIKDKHSYKLFVGDKILFLLFKILGMSNLLNGLCLYIVDRYVRENKHCTQEAIWHIYKYCKHRYVHL